MAPDAPPEVTELTVASAGKDGIDFRWTKPRGATRFDLHGGDEPSHSALAWNGLPAVTGEYTVADGAAQTARLPWPPGAQIVSAALKSANARGDFSGISNWASAAAPPLKRVVLRNGPAGPWETPAYSATQACFLDAGRPSQPAGKALSKLEVRTTSAERALRQKLILIRFKDLPRLAALEHATLELTTDPQFRDKPQLEVMSSVDVTCSVIRDDWDAATATYAQAAPGKPWAARELDTGGKFVSAAERHSMVQQRLTFRWDITQAVRDALKEGRTSVSLLIRAEHTGPYCNSMGYVFCGPDWPQVERRPRLCIVAKD